MQSFSPGTEQHGVAVGKNSEDVKQIALIYLGRNIVLPFKNRTGRQSCKQSIG